MAAGGEQTRSAHARDVSLGARIALKIITAGAFTAKVTISRDNLGHKCQGTHHFNVM